MVRTSPKSRNAVAQILARSSEKAVDGFVFSQRDDPTRTSRAFLEDSGQRRERNTPGRLCLHNFSECNRRINYETS